MCFVYSEAWLNSSSAAKSRLPTDSSLMETVGLMDITWLQSSLYAWVNDTQLNVTRENAHIEKQLSKLFL